MFAQPRISVGIGVGGYGGGYYQQPPPYAYVPPCPPYESWVNGFCVADYGYERPFYGGYGVAPRFDNHFDNDRNRGVERGRSFSGDNRGQARGFSSGQGQASGRNQNQSQNRGGGNRSGGGGSRGR
jgi:hypothetical protein